MLRPAVGISPNPVGGGAQAVAFNIQTMQMIAMHNGVFIRCLSTPIELTPFESAIHRSVSHWRIDGITAMLSKRDCNVVFHSRNQGRVLSQLRVDLRLPLNQPIEIQLGHYEEPILPNFQADDGIVYEDDQLLGILTAPPEEEPVETPEQHFDPLEAREQIEFSNIDDIDSGF